MNTAQKDEATPDNEKGKFVDEEASVIENSEEEAVVTYNRACARLLNPPIWEQLTPGINANFEISLPGQEKVERLLQQGDYVSIDIPGPGSAAGEGYDWVKVETIEENTAPGYDDSLALRLRACTNPHTPDAAIAHFFDESATSSFVVKRKGKEVIFSYHGRNEVPNTSDVKMVDKIRNALVALGAKAGLSEVYWKTLAKGMLQKEIGG
jgi:hypothetical protein